MLNKVQKTSARLEDVLDGQCTKVSKVAKIYRNLRKVYTSAKEISDLFEEAIFPISDLILSIMGQIQWEIDTRRYAGCGVDPWGLGECGESTSNP